MSCSPWRASRGNGPSPAKPRAPGGAASGGSSPDIAPNGAAPGVSCLPSSFPRLARHGLQDLAAPRLETGGNRLVNPFSLWSGLCYGVPLGLASALVASHLRCPAKDVGYAQGGGGGRKAERAPRSAGGGVRGFAAAGIIWARFVGCATVLTPSPVSPRLMKAPVASHPLPQGGEGREFKSRE
jgi:hypothetical protein